MTEEAKVQEQMAEAATEQDKKDIAEEVTEEVNTAHNPVIEDKSETAIEEVDLTQMTSLKKGDLVKGTIVKVEDTQALVDIGYKYDGIIPIRELSSLTLENASEAVSVGQEVELRVVSIDDEKEKLLLSKRAIDSEKGWEQLQSLFESRETIEAVVADVVKGGLVVDLGVRGFIPASMVERHFVEDFSDYKGRTLKLRVKEIDRINNKVILSRKEILEEEHEANKKMIMAGFSVGQELEGTVQRLTPFGAFIDLGGVDGLVHVSEISWSHVERPSDVLKEGEKVSVKILKLDPAADRISLSIKAAQPGPWSDAESKFKIGGIVSGTVKRLAGFGAFVEIAPGVEGLVHISQIAHRHIGTPHEVLKEGQQVQVKILDLNIQEKRVSLSIKETEEAPAQAPKADKPRGGKQQQQEAINNENVSMSNQGLSLTLGERLGDKLNKFK